MKKQRKGITLIALVITIIILLILSGITLNLTIGQKGIITRAQEAGKNYQEATKREEQELANFWAESENIIHGNNGGGTITTPPEGGDNTDPEEPTINISTLKTGDYIKYDTGVSTLGENGIMICRVLYSKNSEYGLQIISDKTTGEVVTLGGNTWEEGKTSYNGAIKTLNDKALKYVNTEYAYDGRCVGSIPTVSNGMFVDKNKLRDSEGNIRDIIDTVSVPMGWTLPTGWASRDTGCYNTDMNYGTDETALREADMWTTEITYWLASRCVYSINMNICVRHVSYRGALSDIYLCNLNSVGYTKGNSYESGFRPCISLKSDNIRITGGDGMSEETAYTIGK